MSAIDRRLRRQLRHGTNTILLGSGAAAAGCGEGGGVHLALGVLVHCSIAEFSR